jgi:hypothetical protein
MHPINARVRVAAGVFALASLVVVLGASAASAAPSRSGFGFNARDISGAPTGAVTLTGGGAFDPSTGFVHSGGGFRCTTTVGQGPLAGCLAGQGVRWDTDSLLTSTAFKCTGAASEALKVASTDARTAVLHADFYRAGDGIHESFTANMIVASHDLAPDITGMQDVWVQGVGCADGITHFGA